MKLQPGWRFGSPGEIDIALVRRFSELIGLMASQGSRRGTFEHFKGYYAGPAGRQNAYSSSESWAESDLDDFMRGAASNAPLFLEAFIEGARALAQSGIDIPDDAYINGLLADHGVGYRVQGDAIIASDPNAHLPTTNMVPLSLNEQGRMLVLDSFALSSRLFDEGRHRQGVQELLWLLETVSTAFRGLDTGDQTVKGKYFNEIVRALREARKGSIVEQALVWMSTMHGYLSAPSGGGIRHGQDLNTGIEMTENDAVLVANLVRSYIQFLMSEHQRMTGNALGASPPSFG